jgi:hypothetical protein
MIRRRRLWTLNCWHIKLVIMDFRDLLAVEGDGPAFRIDAIAARWWISPSMRPLSTARGLDTNDKGLCRVVMRRTNANLKHRAKKSLIRSMPSPGQQLLWDTIP